MGMCLNGTYPFLSATLVRQLPYYLFRETCFMDSYLPGRIFIFYASRLDGYCSSRETFGSSAPKRAMLRSHLRRMPQTSFSSTGM